MARLPRHFDLELSDIAVNLEEEDLPPLRSVLQALAQTASSSPAKDEEDIKGKRRVGGMTEFERKLNDKRMLGQLRKEFEGMTVKSRAKVTDDRIYSVAYHPEPVSSLLRWPPAENSSFGHA